MKHQYFYLYILHIYFEGWKLVLLNDGTIAFIFTEVFVENMSSKIHMIDRVSPY
jgi:hypothetical protein